MNTRHAPSIPIINVYYALCPVKKHYKWQSDTLGIEFRKATVLNLKLYSRHIAVVRVGTWCE